MDKFPVCCQGRAVGELEVERESLYTAFSVRAMLPEKGLWGAWLVGTTGELRLGILEPDDREGTIRRRFSDRMLMPLGTILRGEIRPVPPKTGLWEPVSKPEVLFHSRRLTEELRKEKGLLARQGNAGHWIAVPYDKEKTFPLVDLFCFAELLKIDGRTYLAFCFDQKEQIVFGNSGIHSSCQRLEKN